MVRFLSYKPLLKLLVERGMTKLQFADAVGISTNTLAKFSKDDPVGLAVIVKICNVFGCEISDIVELRA